MSKLDEIEARVDATEFIKRTGTGINEEKIRLLIRAVRELEGAFLEAEKHAQANRAFRGLFRRLRTQLGPDVLELIRDG